MTGGILTFMLLLIELGTKLGTGESCLYAFLWAFVYCVVFSTLTFAFKRKLVETWDVFFKDEPYVNSMAAVVPEGEAQQQERQQNRLLRFF